MTIFVIILLVLLSFAVGAYGSSRKIGFGWAFLWSLLLSPIIGFIIAFASKSLDDEAQKQESLDLQKQQVEKLDEIKTINSIQQISRAKELLDSGAITQEEYDILKMKLLNSIVDPAKMEITSNNRKIESDANRAIEDIKKKNPNNPYGY